MGDVNERMAEKFQEAAWGNASITDEDLATLGIKKQKTFTSKTYGRRLNLNGWEALCVYVYEKLTGEKHPGIHSLGRGFRSREAVEPVVNELMKRAA